MGRQKAIEFIRQRGAIAFGDFRKICPDLAGRTLRKDLADLVDLELIRPIGEKRGRKYLLR